MLKNKGKNHIMVSNFLQNSFFLGQNLYTLGLKFDSGIFRSICYFRALSCNAILKIAEVFVLVLRQNLVFRE
jgi:hypothetical protein